MLNISRQTLGTDHAFRAGGAGRTGPGQLDLSRLAAGANGNASQGDGLMLSGEAGDGSGGEGGGISNLLSGMQSWGGGEQPLAGGAVAEQVATLSKNAAAAEGGSQEGSAGERKQLEQSFDQAIAKLENAPKKAKEKMEPGTIENVKQKKDESLRAHDQASEAEERAKEATADVPEVGDEGAEGGEGDKAQAAYAGNEGLGPDGKKKGKFADPLAGKLKALSARGRAGRGGREEMVSRQMGGSPPTSNVSDSSSMPELKNAMCGRMNYAGSLDQGFDGLRGRHGAESGQAEELGRTVDGLGGIGDAYGAKEEAHGAKQQAFQTAGQSMLKAAQGLKQAAQMMMQVAGILMKTAAAVAAIPFVGPALAAALKKAAMVVQMIAKVLQMLSQMLAQGGQKKLAEAAQEGQARDYNKAKGVETRVAEAQARNQLEESKQALEQHQREDEELAQRRAENLAEMNRIADLIRNKGGSANVSGGEDELDRDPELDNRGKKGNERLGKHNRPGQGGNVGAGAPAPAAPSPASNNNAGGQAVSTAPTSGALKPGAASADSTPKVAAAAPSSDGSNQGGGGEQSGERAGRATPTSGSTPGSSTGSTGNDGNSDEKKPGSSLKEDKSKKGKTEQRPVEIRQADRANRMAKANKARKTEANVEDEGQSQETQVQLEAGQKQKQTEDQLRQLAQSIKDSRAAGAAGSSMERRGNQRQLGMLYNDTVQTRVPIRREIDELVRQQMKDAPDRLTGRAQIAGDDDQAMALAGGAGNQGWPLGGKSPFGKSPFGKSPFANAMAGKGQAALMVGQARAQGGHGQGQGGDLSAQPSNGNSAQVAPVAESRRA